MRTQALVLLVLLSLVLLGQGDDRLLWRENLVVEVAGGPVVQGERAAVVTRNGGLFVFAFDGQLLIQRDLEAPFVAAPSFDDSGTLWLADLYGQLRRVDRDGREAFVFKGETPFRAPPLQGPAEVVVCDETGKMRRIERGSGRIIMESELDSPVFSGGVITRDHAVLQPSKDYKLFRVASDGSKQLFLSGSGVIFSSPALCVDGRIALTSMDHHLYLLKPDGKIQFRFRAGRWIIASPVIDETGRIYFGSYDKHFYAVDADGKLAWRIEGLGGFNASAVIDDKGVIYTGDGSGRVYAVARNGQILWRYKTQDYVRSSLALFESHSVLLVPSLDGHLYALKSEAPLSKRAQWPSYMGDGQNSGRYQVK